MVWSGRGCGRQTHCPCTSPTIFSGASSSSSTGCAIKISLALLTSEWISSSFRETWVAWTTHENWGFSNCRCHHRPPLLPREQDSAYWSTRACPLAPVTPCIPEAYETAAACYYIRKVHTAQRPPKMSLTQPPPPPPATAVAPAAITAASVRDIKNLWISNPYLGMRCHHIILRLACSRCERHRWQG